MIALSSVPEIIADIRSGKPVIMVDDADRENEGDLVIATGTVTPEVLSFMMREARGLICVSISRERAERLSLPLQELNNNSQFQTAFAVSIDHLSVQEQGVTAIARAETMRRLVDPRAGAADFVSPGHVVPLIAHPAGVLGRQGQTEGSYDLARLAGFEASGVICEILNPDGTMARGRDLEAFAEKHQLRITSVRNILQYRVNQEILVRKVSQEEIQTDYGRFLALAFENDVDGREHLALIYGEPLALEAPLVRIHSECLTGDVFGSLRCDCGPQLSLAMQEIVRQGSGILLYLRQEGRGIGLTNKVRAYALQDQGHDTVQANLALGFPADMRDFAVAAKILSALGIYRVCLMTNNPEKIQRLESLGVKVAERKPLNIAANPYSEAYLDTKREKLGHLI